LDFEWIDAIKEKNDRPCFIYAEGVFMYLHEEEVKSLVLKLQSSFPGAELACEVASKKIIKLMQSRLGRRKFQRRFHLKEGVTYHFGIENSNDFEKWSPKIKFLDEWTYFDEPEKKLGWFRLFRNVKSFRYAQWTVHYKFV
jgi:O-methyltransferase involved in polyketide biosynthesis